MAWSREETAIWTERNALTHPLLCGSRPGKQRGWEVGEFLLSQGLASSLAAWLSRCQDHHPCPPHPTLQGGIRCVLITLLSSAFRTLKS